MVCPCIYQQDPHGYWRDFIKSTGIRVDGGYELIAQTIEAVLPPVLTRIVLALVHELEEVCFCRCVPLDPAMPIFCSNQNLAQILHLEQSFGDSGFQTAEDEHDGEECHELYEVCLLGDTCVGIDDKTRLLLDWDDADRCGKDPPDDDFIEALRQRAKGREFVLVDVGLFLPSHAHKIMDVQSAFLPFIWSFDYSDEAYFDAYCRAWSERVSKGSAV